MCEIFFQYNRDGVIDPDNMNKIIQQAKMGAKSNKDGWGFFDSEGQLFKWPNQFGKDEDSIKAVREHLQETAPKFWVLHLRNGTEGEAVARNTHPFEKDGVFFVHNGVITDGQVAEEDPDTDSERLFHRILEKDTSLIQAIKDTMDEEYGSVSCFLYDHDEDRLLYWRHGSSFTIAFDEDKNEILGATRDNRLERIVGETKLHFFQDTRDILMKDPVKNSIYEVSNRGIIFKEPFEGSKKGYYKYKNKGKKKGKNKNSYTSKGKKKSGVQGRRFFNNAGEDNKTDKDTGGDKDFAEDKTIAEAVYEELGGAPPHKDEEYVSLDEVTLIDTRKEG